MKSGLLLLGLIFMATGFLLPVGIALILIWLYTDVKKDYLVTKDEKEYKEQTHMNYEEMQKWR